MANFGWLRNRDKIRIWSSRVKNTSFMYSFCSTFALLTFHLIWFGRKIPINVQMPTNAYFIFNSSIWPWPLISVKRNKGKRERKIQEQFLSKPSKKTKLFNALRFICFCDGVKRMPVAFSLENLLPLALGPVKERAKLETDQNKF